MEGNQRNESGRAYAAVNLSFDDGRADNAVLFDELLIPARIPMSLNIATGYLDGTCPAATRPTEKAPMSVEDLQRFAANPLVEIAMHGDAHLNTEEDILRGEAKLRTWLHLEQSIPLGFASPNSGMDLSFFRSPAGEALRERVAYLRTGPRISSQKALRLFCRKVGRVIHLPLLYRIAYHDTIMTERDGKILYSVPRHGEHERAPGPGGSPGLRQAPGGPGAAVPQRGRGRRILRRLVLEQGKNAGPYRCSSRHAEAGNVSAVYQRGTICQITGA